MDGGGGNAQWNGRRHDTARRPPFQPPSTVASRFWVTVRPCSELPPPPRRRYSRGKERVRRERTSCPFPFLDGVTTTVRQRKRHAPGVRIRVRVVRGNFVRFALACAPFYAAVICRVARDGAVFVWVKVPRSVPVIASREIRGPRGRRTGEYASPGRSCSVPHSLTIASKATFRSVISLRRYV